MVYFLISFLFSLNTNASLQITDPGALLNEVDQFLGFTPFAKGIGCSDQAKGESYQCDLVCNGENCKIGQCTGTVLTRIVKKCELDLRVIEIKDQEGIQTLEFTVEEYQNLRGNSLRYFLKILDNSAIESKQEVEVKMMSVKQTVVELSNMQVPSIAVQFEVTESNVLDSKEEPMQTQFTVVLGKDISFVTQMLSMSMQFSPLKKPMPVFKIQSQSQ